MVEYVVEAKSRRQLRSLASILRKHLGLENELYFPVVEMFMQHWQCSICD